MSLQELIGQTLVFTANPYYSGTATLESVEEQKFCPYRKDDIYLINIRTVDATETSRLFHAKSTQEWNGMTLRIYWFTRAEIERAIANVGYQSRGDVWDGLRYTFPV